MNKFIFENQFYSSRELIQMTSEDMEDYKSAQAGLKDIKDTGVTCETNKRRKRPNPDEVKASWDAALDTKSTRMRDMIIISDAKGEVWYLFVL